MKKIIRIMMVIVMFFILTFSVLNFVTIESRAGGLDNGLPGSGGSIGSYDGTTVELPDGTTACQGAALDCKK